MSLIQHNFDFSENFLRNAIDFGSSIRFLKFPPGTIVRIYGKEAGQVVTSDATTQKILVKYLPCIDYEQLKTSEIKSQKYINMKMPSDYKPKKIYFVKNFFIRYKIKLDEEEIPIPYAHNGVAKAIKWDGDLFIGIFQYSYFSMEDLQIQNLNITKEEYSIFENNRADFEGHDPIFNENMRKTKKTFEQNNFSLLNTRNDSEEKMNQNESHISEAKIKVNEENIIKPNILWHSQNNQGKPVRIENYIKKETQKSFSQQTEFEPKEQQKPQAREKINENKEQQISQTRKITNDNKEKQRVQSEKISENKEQQISQTRKITNDNKEKQRVQSEKISENKEQQISQIRNAINENREQQISQIIETTNENKEQRISQIIEIINEDKEKQRVLLEKVNENKEQQIFQPRETNEDNEREISQQHREEYTLYHVQAKANTQQRHQSNKNNQWQQIPQILHSEQEISKEQMLQRPQAVQETVQPQIQQIQQKPQSNKDNQQQQQMPQLQSAQELTQQSMQQRNKDVPEQQIQKRLQETREIPQQHREEYTLYHVQAKSNTQQKPQINKDIPQKQPMQQRRQLTHDNQQQQMPQLLSVQELTQQRNKDITEQQIQKRSQETREMPQQHREEYTLYHVQAEANTHKLQPVQETVLPQIQQRIHSNKDNQQQQISHTEHKISQRQMPQKQQSNKDNQQQPMPQTCEDILYQQQISHTLSEALQQFQINSNEEDQAETSSEQALEKLIEYCKNSKDITKLRHIYKILDEMKQQHETPQQEQPKQTELRQPKYWPYDLVRLNSNLVGTVINITETDDTIILQNNRIETVTEDKIVKKLSPQPKVIDCHKTQLFIGDRVKFNETKEGKIIQMYNKHLYVELPDNSFQCVPARLVESLSPKNRSCSVIGEKIIYIKGKHVYSKPLKITDVTTRKGLTVTDNRGNERSFPLELHGKKWVYENEFQSLLESGAL